MIANPDAMSSASVPYLVVLQHDLLDMVPTVMVAPLVRRDILELVSGLHLNVSVAGEEFTLAMSDMFPILRGSLRSPALTTVADKRDEIIRCLDRLFVGF